MQARSTWTFARTKVVDDPEEAARFFRVLVTRIEQATGSLVNYAKDFRDSSPLGFQSDRAEWSQHAEPKAASFEATYVRCPLPLFQLPNGARPFVVDTLMGGHGARGWTEFVSAEDSRFSTLFAVLIEKGLQFLLQQSWATPDKNAIFSWSTGRHFENENDSDPELKTQHHVDVFFNAGFAPRPQLFEEVFSAAGLPLGDADRTNRELTDRFTWNIDGRIRPEEIVGVVRGVERSMRSREGWTLDSPLTLSVYERIKSVERIRQGRCFDDLAAELNSVSRDWNMEFNAFYHTDFDPFGDPEIIPEESGEIRLPIGKLKRSPVWFDLVHDAIGTFLEIRTTKNRGAIKTLAKEIDVAVEFWEGEAAGRWIGA